MSITVDRILRKFCEIVSPIFAGRLYPAVQKNGLLDSLPACIYYRDSPETIIALHEGLQAVAMGMQFEIHCRRYDETVELSDAVLRALNEAGSLIRVGSGADDFDQELNLYRRIQRVTIQ